MTANLFTHIVKIDPGCVRRVCTYQAKRRLSLLSIYLALTSLAGFISAQRPVPAFLLFLVSALLIYSLPMSGSYQAYPGIGDGACDCARCLACATSSTWKSSSRSAVFASLALGLNIVVGFTGLLNLGYVAFYAVGAYLWAIFGSQQLFLLHAIPGTAPVTNAFFLAGELLLPVFVPGRWWWRRWWASCWACRCCACAAITWPSSPWALAR